MVRKIFKWLCFFFFVDPLSVGWHEGHVSRDDGRAVGDQQTGLWGTRLPSRFSPGGRSSIGQGPGDCGRGEHCALPAGRQVCNVKKEVF